MPVSACATIVEDIHCFAVEITSNATFPTAGINQVKAWMKVTGRNPPPELFLQFLGEEPVHKVGKWSHSLQPFMH